MPDRVPERTWANVISFLIVVCTCPILTAVNWPSFGLPIYLELVSVTYYISLYVGAKRLVFHLSPRDSHVIIVSGCLILTAVNLIVLIRIAYITKRLVKLCKIYCDIWHRRTWTVCTGGRAGVRYVITKFSQMDSLPNFLTHGAPVCARLARARSSATNINIKI